MTSGLVTTLTTAIGWLDDMDVGYMIVGSIASTTHGQPRSTNDIDMIIRVEPDEAQRIAAAANAEGWYASEAQAVSAAERTDMFNVVNTAAGFKVDFIILDETAWGRAEFARRVRADVFGIPCWVASAEDTIIAKLVWSASSQSEMQLRDVGSVYQNRFGSLDEVYMDRWADELGVRQALDQLRETVAREIEEQ